MLFALLIWLILPTCPSEDSGNFCKWESKRGQSFVVIAGELIYVESL